MDRCRRGSNCSDLRGGHCGKRVDSFYAYNDDKTKACAPPYPHNSRVFYYEYKCQKPNSYVEDESDCCQYPSRYRCENKSNSYKSNSDRKDLRQLLEFCKNCVRQRYGANSCDEDNEDVIQSIRSQAMNLKGPQAVNVTIDRLIAYAWNQREYEVKEFLEHVKRELNPKPSPKYSDMCSQSPNDLCRRCRMDTCNCRRERSPPESVEYRDHWDETYGRQKGCSNYRSHDEDDRDGIMIQHRTLDDADSDECEYPRSYRHSYRGNHETDSDTCHYRSQRGRR